MKNEKTIFTLKLAPDIFQSELIPKSIDG